MKNISKLPVLLLSSAAFGFIGSAQAANVDAAQQENAKSFLVADSTAPAEKAVKLKAAKAVASKIDDRHGKHGHKHKMLGSKGASGRGDRGPDRMGR